MAATLRQSTPRDEVAFLFIGGPHQVFHLAPVAAELSRLAPGLAVTCLYPDEPTGRLIGITRDAFAAPALRLERIEAPWLGRALGRLAGTRSATKLPMLARLKARVAQSRAVVTPERTSTFLRWMGLSRKVPLVHFRHGAGDRAPASEKRMTAFDLLVLPGEKDVERAVLTHHVPPEKIRTCGYVKLDLIDRLPPPPAPPRRRPLVLYNPHFDAGISSWPMADAIVAAFAAQDRYELVVAPHLRLSMDLGPAARAHWLAKAMPGRIAVDLGSDRLVDMSWTRAADIYLGDMSSQLYEFLVTPRPCAFVDAHHAAWRDDPRYGGWHLGEVAGGPGEVLAAIDRAVAVHPARIAAQREAVARAFGDPHGAAERGARILLDALHIAQSLPEKRPIATA